MCCKMKFYYFGEIRKCSPGANSLQQPFSPKLAQEQLSGNFMFSFSCWEKTLLYQCFPSKSRRNDSFWKTTESSPDKCPLA